MPTLPQGQHQRNQNQSPTKRIFQTKARNTIILSTTQQNTTNTKAIPSPTQQQQHSNHNSPILTNTHKQPFNPTTKPHNNSPSHPKQKTKQTTSTQGPITHHNSKLITNRTNKQHTLLQPLQLYPTKQNQSTTTRRPQPHTKTKASSQHIN